MNELAQLFEPSHPNFNNLMILLVVLASLILLPIVKHKLASSRHSILIKALLSAIHIPARWFIITAALWLMLKITLEIFHVDAEIMTYPVMGILVFMHVVWYGFRVIRCYELSSLEVNTEGKLDKTAITGIAKLLRLLLTAILAIVGFDLLGLDPSGLIALGSVSGAALAFASKDLVSNWFGGIMLYMDKPFKVGDWIRSPDRDIEGVVEYIGWRITKIRTFDKRPLYVPNSLFNSITVQNPSRMTHRRINETVGVRYDDMEQVNTVVDAIKNYLKASNIIAQDQVIIVNFNGFGQSSLDIMIYCMTITTDWRTFHQHKQTLLLDIANIIAEHDCEFAYPTQRIMLESTDEH